MKRGQGSLSSRGGANWTRQGADYRKRQESAVLQRGPEGQAGRVLPCSVGVLRRAIEAQICPWCSAGPYKVLAAHTHKAHGVSAAELRQMAGYTTRTRLCSPDASANARERLIARPDREEITARGTVAAVAVGAHSKAAATRADREQGRNRERDALILQLYGESYLVRQIADRVGMSAKGVSGLLHRLGVMDDGRSTRYRNADFRAAANQNLASAAQSRLDNLAAQQSQRAAEYRDLGGGWDAIDVLAERWQVTSKTVRAYLRDAGEVVPDGRGCSPRRGGPRPAGLALEAEDEVVSDSDGHPLPGPSSRV